MIIREAKFKKCKSCASTKRISDEVYGCDFCKKQIDYINDQSSYLEVAVFTKNKGTTHLHLCSWQCVFDVLVATSTDYFVSLPHLMFDETGPRSAKAFYDAFYGHSNPTKPLLARIRQLERAIRWALGYTNFRQRLEGEGQYWWRKELRKRAGSV
jgi:hypothetical protein